MLAWPHTSRQRVFLRVGGSPEPAKGRGEPWAPAMSQRSTPSLFDRQAGARRPAASYALSFAALAAAVLLRYLLDSWMGDALPLVTLFGAVAMAVWLGGYVPAVIVTI